MARRTGCRTPVVRAGARDRGLHRGRHRGGAADGRTAARRHRGTAHGRHEDRRRPVRCREDVPPAGGQERAGDEAFGRLPGTLHGGGQARIRPRQREGRARDGQGRRTRHRKEHRRRRARLQQLRRRGPGCDGSRGHHPRHGGGRERRRRRAFRPHHAVAGRDGRGGHRDATAWHEAAAADRRRHDVPPAHGGAHRARVRRRGRARARRVPGRRRGVGSAEPGPGRRSGRGQPGRAGTPARAARGQGTAPAAHARAGPVEQGRCRLRRPARPRVHRRAYRRTRHRHPARVHRLAVPLPRLGAEGQVPGDPRPAGGPGTVRRRERTARPDRGGRRVHRPWRVRLLAGALRG